MEEKTDNADKVACFLKALADETAWEWKWEKHQRRWVTGINWLSWFSRFLILALAWFQWSGTEKRAVPPWVPLSIAILAMLNVALPLLTSTFRFQQRQEVHDRNAKAYDCIKVKMETGQIDLATAVERFSKIREHPTEKSVRTTP